MNLLALPDTVLYVIFEYLSYDEVAKKREVCRRFDQIGQAVLNAGFLKVTHKHSQCFKRLKALLPRRESERRVHILARHADIFTSIETRISMLAMTYSKYMDLNLCCFIPGRVLDEIYNIFSQIENSTKPLRPHEVLQELRDISSMAIEHFDEKIAVNFKHEHRTKLAEHGRLPAGGLSDISFSGVNTTVKSWNSVGTTTNRSPFLRTTTSTCCDEIIQNVQEILGLSQTKSTHRPLPHTEPIPDLPELQMPPAAEQKEIFIHIPMSTFKRLEDNYQKGIIKMRRMHNMQVQQSRRLQEAYTAIAELTTQVSELKKQIEDVVAAKGQRELNLTNATTANTASNEISTPAITKPKESKNATEKVRKRTATTASSSSSNSSSSSSSNTSSSTTTSSDAGSSCTSAATLPIKKPKI